MSKDGYYGDFESMAEEQAVYDKEERLKQEKDEHEKEYYESLINTIEFNKKYTKLPQGIKTAVLVAAEPVRLREQTDFLLWYDEYPYKHWELMPDGDYLCLVLKSDTGAIFTTLRKDNSENRQKYMGNYVGGGQFEKQRPKFNIIIKED